MIMKYTWVKRFDDSDDPLTLREKLKYNHIIFKGRLKSRLVRLGYFVKDFRYKVLCISYKWRVFRFQFAIKIISIKLKMKGKTGIQIEKSPYSESTYITYMYDGLYKNYIRIRVSMHDNPNAKADVYVRV